MGLKAILTGLTVSLVSVGTVSADGLNKKSKAPNIDDVPYIAVPWSWNGFYGGVSLGYASGHTDYYLYQADHGADSIDPSGAAFSLSFGKNWQSGNIVFGAEADIGFMNANDWHNWKDNHVNISNYGAWGTLRGRLGYAMDRWLVFGTAGIAFLETDEIVLGANGGANAGQTSPNEDTHVGWVAGGGVEYAYTDRISFKVDYLHMEFDKYDAQTSANRRFTFENSVDLVRFGVNYKFH